MLTEGRSRLWRRVCTWALAVLLLAEAAHSADAQILRGRVVDAATERGIDNVSLAVIDENGSTLQHALTDAFGRFRLALERGGPFGLRVQRPGYSGFIAEAIALSEGEEAALEVRLAADRIVISPITVIGRRHIGEVDEFEPRLRLMREAGIGQSLVRSEIEQREVLEITDLLATIPDIVITGPPGARTVRFTSGTDASTCAPDIFVNARPLEAPTVDLIGTPQIIDAVELYNGAVERPAEFADPSGCGVVLIWTRPDPADAGPTRWRRAVVYIGMTIVGVVLFSR